jgi:hypothetical protein
MTLIKLSLLLFALLMPSLANALTMGEREYECPLGGQKFTAISVNSYTQFGKRLDLKPFGTFIAPIPLPICPENGFIIYKQDFSEEEVEIIKPFILSSEYQTLRRNNTGHYLLAKVFEYQKEDIEEIAYSYLQASWETERERTRYVKYLGLAIEAYQRVLEKKSITQETEFTARFLLVELNRLRGNFDLAKSKLSDLLKHVEISGFKKKIIELERKLIKDENSVPQDIPTSDD